MRFKESHVDLSTSIGPMRVFLFHPRIPEYPQAKFPAVIVYSEIYQVTEPVKRFARQVAGRGFIVAVPSIYHNFMDWKPLTYDDEGTATGNKYKVEKPLASYDEDNKVVIDYLTSLDTCTGRIGATGMCLGGHLAFRAALDERILTSVTFFATDVHLNTIDPASGPSAQTLNNVDKIRGEILTIFGTADPHVSESGRTLIREALQKASVNYSFYEVAGAQHAFVRDEMSKDRYDPEITAGCQTLMFEMFNRILKLDLGPRVTE